MYLKKISFAVAPKRMKYLGKNLIKEVKDLYSGNYETLIKEVEGDTNGKIYHAHGLEELRHKRHLDWWGRSKTVFADDMILYIYRIS